MSNQFGRTKPNIYDRLWQKREAAEARAGKQAEQEAALALQPPPALPVLPERNAMTIAGLQLLMPQGARLCDVWATLEVGGHSVIVNARSRSVAQTLTLDRALQDYLAEARRQHAEVTPVRQQTCLLAGHPALLLDYLFDQHEARRHCRTVLTQIPPSDGHEALSFSLSTVIDPDLRPLADWLIDFDAMLAAITCA
ncbi:hypothetical protein [Pseudomonas sp.]|uniref:hypothetical protein n=1 Tax=Pseudomonas sp. TaxID=306 RepID=UPI0028B0D450|nr:hypothetical protein [Pseudomonas sp.]